MSHQDITIFQKAWNIVDKEHRGVIDALRARFCLRLVYKELGLGEPLLLRRMMVEVERNHGNKVTFHNLLFIVARRKIKDMKKALTLEDYLKREENERVILEEAALQVLGKVIKDFVGFVSERSRFLMNADRSKSFFYSVLA